MDYGTPVSKRKRGNKEDIFVVVEGSVNEC
jgi:hypothetical protein